MRYVMWLLKIALFLLVLTFAAKNTAPVTVRYYLGNEWDAPLVLVLLVFFVLGALFGIVAGLAKVFRQRREIAALKRELRARQGNPALESPHDAG
jgi:lipopolysaccharide assembly protein A